VDRKSDRGLEQFAQKIPPGARQIRDASITFMRERSGNTPRCGSSGDQNALNWPSTVSVHEERGEILSRTMRRIRSWSSDVGCGDVAPRESSRGQRRA